MPETYFAVGYLLWVFKKVMKANFGQRYFLITPKLLSNLAYHPRMKVHTINSGDWVDVDYKIDAMKCVAKAKSLKARGIVVA